MFRFLGSRLFALLERGAARLAASRIEISFEPIPPEGGSGIPGETWDSITIRPAAGDKARPHRPEADGPVEAAPLRR